MKEEPLAPPDTGKLPACGRSVKSQTIACSKGLAKMALQFAWRFVSVLREAERSMSPVRPATPWRPSGRECRVLP